MSEDVYMDPVVKITIGTVGEPGQRVFMLQARDEDTLLTLIMEKVEALALGRGAYELLVAIGSAELAASFIGEKGYFTQMGPLPEEMALEPDEPAWRVDAMSLGFDEDRDRAVIMCTEWVSEEEEDEEEAATARFVLTRQQLAALGVHAMAVVAQGRPTCPMCGLVMESEEHVCPAVNGHGPMRTEEGSEDEG